MKGRRLDQQSNIESDLNPCNELASGNERTDSGTNVTDFGLFVELEEGVEGLVHISEMRSDGRGDPISRYRVGDGVLARVINVSRENKKIGLSLRRL